MNRAITRGAILSVSALVVVLGMQENAHAQFGRGSRSVGRTTQNFLYNRPTVSPYLNLTTRDASNGLPNYFTMVRPQLDRRQQDVAQQRQNASVQRQLSQVQNQVRETQQQQAGSVLTGRMGWSSRGMPRFGNTLNFYPASRRR